MYVCYLDDSRDPDLVVCTALMVSSSAWLEVFGRLKGYRSERKRTEGFFMRKEWHATDFVSGRGRISDQVITKRRRAKVFIEALTVLAGCADLSVRLINVLLPRKDELRAYERLLNRINRAMVDWETEALLIWDAGKDAEYRRLARKMSVYNPIPSKYAQWAETGERTKNIPLDRIIEDPVFKDSADSFFLQMVDFCAFALLRRESPIPARSKYGLDKAFDVLAPILHLPASEDDAEGIVREKENPG